MENLLQRSFHENFKLSLPSGLAELMSDISREVLRARPSNLYQFITNYLAAMLVTRENISIAADICSQTCTGPCYKELNEALREIGLDKEDIEKSLDVILEYFEKGKVKETNLIMELIRKTNVNEEMLPAIQEAVKTAFKRQQLLQEDVQDINSKFDIEDDSCAVKHTLELYKKTRPRIETYHTMANKIQASYPAYGVKYQCTNEIYNLTKQVKDAKRVSLDVDEVNEEHRPKTRELTALRTLSSTTLAGSYINLPKYKPYSPHSSIVITEIEDSRGTIYYTDIGNPEENSSREDDALAGPETIFRLKNEHTTDKENIKVFEPYVEDEEYEEINEENCQMSEYDKSEDNIDEDIKDNTIEMEDDDFIQNNDEIEDICVSDPEE